MRVPSTYVYRGESARIDSAEWLWWRIFVYFSGDAVVVLSAPLACALPLLSVVVCQWTSPLHTTSSRLLAHVGLLVD